MKNRSLKKNGLKTLVIEASILKAMSGYLGGYQETMLQF